MNQNCIKIAKDANLLICESTFASDLKEKAHEYLHLTAEEAATIAKRAKVKKLILTHFSQRYKEASIFEKEARSIFKNTFLANDFMTVQL